MRPLPQILVLWAGVAVAACGTEPDAFSLENCTLSRDEFFDGGVARDGIPALTDPEAIPATAESFLDDDDRVLGVVINGEARAYPMIVLWWHEVVNDTLGGQNILVTYCPLTGSGLVFDPRAGGSTRQFGVSGLLRENNLVMFDRETESLWNQMLLGAQCGAERGTNLDLLPVVEATWGYWRTLHPTTTVVTTNTGRTDIPYGVYPYGTYDEPNNAFTTFPSSPYDRSRPPKELVLGIFDGEESAAYAFGILTGMGPGTALNDEIAARPVLVTFQPFEQTAHAFDRRVDGQVLTFEIADTTAMTMIDAETGTTWSAVGEAEAGPLAGQQLTPVENAYVAFWFAWSVYHPETRLVF